MRQMHREKLKKCLKPMKAVSSTLMTNKTPLRKGLQASSAMV